MEVDPLEPTSWDGRDAGTEIVGLDDLDVEGVRIAVRSIPDGRGGGGDVRFLPEVDAFLTLCGGPGREMLIIHGTTERAIMDIHSLGYIGIGVRDVEQWRDYAGTLGTMAVPYEDGFGIRIDDRPFRVLVEPDQASEGLRFAGWEVADSTALSNVAVDLGAAGVAVTPVTSEECAQRRVRGMVRATDPGGLALEFFHGPILDHEPFVSPTGLSGFVTGAQGLGHIVLGTTDVDVSVDFYTRVLGFRVSDYWRPGDEDVVFLRCNSRHHSLALVPASEPALYHFMVEARTLDDVGATLDRHRDSGRPISMSLGRHTNDHMVSFYGQTPSGFDVEFGFGGRHVDEQSWTVSQITKPSVWGHHPPGSTSQD